MGNLLLNILFLLIGMIVLIIASDKFVEASSSLAIKLKVPKMLIALTIAAFGTCAPELAISFNSIASANAEVTIANVVGSCIVNILLIIGVAAVVSPIKVKDRTIKKELPILLFVTTAFFLVFSDRIFLQKDLNTLTRADAFMLICWFIFFIYYIISVVRKNRQEHEEQAKYSLNRSIIYIIVTLILIIISSNIVVDNAVSLASILGVSQKTIAMTIIVIGTSLPELTLTVTSAKKEEFDMAIGNIIGTNIFNICIVLGLPTVIYGEISSPSFGIVDNIVVLLAAILLYIFGKSNKELTKREGICMLLVFIVYYMYMLIF